jgi:hypothetical protein
MNTIRSAFNLLISVGFSLMLCIVTYWVGVDLVRALLLEENTVSGIQVTALLIMVVMCIASFLDVWKRWRSLWK